MPRNQLSKEQQKRIIMQIRPGWKRMSAQASIPKAKKTTIETLRTENLRRVDIHCIYLKPQPANWPRQRCIDWLTTYESTCTTEQGSSDSVLNYIVCNETKKEQKNMKSMMISHLRKFRHF